VLPPKWAEHDQIAPRTLTNAWNPPSDGGQSLKSDVDVLAAHSVEMEHVYVAGGIDRLGADRVADCERVGHRLWSEPER